MIKRDLAKKVATLDKTRFTGISSFVATGEFRIDTTRTYHGMTLKTMTVSQAIALHHDNMSYNVMRSFVIILYMYTANSQSA